MSVDGQPPAGDDGPPGPAPDAAAEAPAAGDARLARIERLLRDGLATEWATRAYTDDAVHQVCRRLQALPGDDLESRLVIAGFTLEPYVDPADDAGIEQSCATCMYFERHRGWCALPELQLPVAPEWSCVLWRI